MQEKPSERQPSPNVLEHLREMISDGKMPPEAKMPSERTLAMEFGVGRRAIREAIINAAGKQVLHSVLRSLALLLVRSRKLTAQSTPATRKIIRQHRTIYEAIRLGGADLAEQTRREHLQTAGLDLLSYQSAAGRGSVGR